MYRWVGQTDAWLWFYHQSWETWQPNANVPLFSNTKHHQLSLWWTFIFFVVFHVVNKLLFIQLMIKVVTVLSSETLHASPLIEVTEAFLFLHSWSDASQSSFQLTQCFFWGLQQFLDIKLCLKASFIVNALKVPTSYGPWMHLRVGQHRLWPFKQIKYMCRFHSRS